MTRALVTRPAEDSTEIIRALESRGVSVLAEPLLTIRHKDGVSIDTAGVQALLFTSANGARAFAAASPLRDLPAFAVGDATADTLRKLGFAKVESGEGDVEDLERLVRRRLDPTRGKLLHAAGTSVAGDLAGRLAQAGFTVDRVQLYDAEPAAELSDAAGAEIVGGRIDWVLVFSPRTAATFASVIERASLVEMTRRMTLVALSDAAAKAATLPFKRVVVAPEPTQAALLKTVDGLIATKAPMTETKPVSSPPLPSPPPPQRPRHAPLIIAAVAATLVIAVIAGSLIVFQPRPVMVASSDVDLSPMTQRLDKIETTLATLGQRLDGVATEARQAGAKASAAADAAARPTEAASSATPVDLSPMEKRIGGLEQSLAEAERRAAGAGAAPPVDLSPIEKRIGGIEQSLAELGRRVASVGAAPPVDLSPIEKRIGGLEQSLAEVGRRAASIGDAERRLTEVERLAKADRHVDTAALAALKLGDALASGRPYKAELALLSGIPGVEPDLKTLSARAETGVPSRAVLIERFPAAAAAAARNADRGDDVWSQLVAKARGLVQVRRLAPGEDLDGRLAQAELAVKSGDLDRALIALDRLPEGAAAALAAWRADAQARLDAERALDRITQALAAGFARAG